MQESKRGRTTTQSAARYWIERLEQEIEDLLAGVDLNDLTSRQRMDLSIKYLGLLQRYHIIEQEQERLREQQENAPNPQQLERLAQWMRTPPPTPASTFDDTQED